MSKTSPQCQIGDHNLCKVVSKSGVHCTCECHLSAAEKAEKHEQEHAESAAFRAVHPDYIPTYGPSNADFTRQFEHDTGITTVHDEEGRDEGYYDFNDLAQADAEQASERTSAMKKTIMLENVRGTMMQNAKDLLGKYVAEGKIIDIHAMVAEPQTHRIEATVEIDTTDVDLHQALAFIRDRKVEQKTVLKRMYAEIEKPLSPAFAAFTQKKLPAEEAILAAIEAEEQAVINLMEHAPEGAWGGVRQGAGGGKGQGKGQGPVYQTAYNAGWKARERKERNMFLMSYVEKVSDLQDRCRQFCASHAEGATEEETKALRLAETRAKAEDLVWHIQLETGYKLEDLQRLFAPTHLHYPELAAYHPEEDMLSTVTRYVETIAGFPSTGLTDHEKLANDLAAFWKKFGA